MSRCAVMRLFLSGALAMLVSSPGAAWAGKKNDTLTRSLAKNAHFQSFEVNVAHASGR